MPPVRDGLRCVTCCPRTSFWTSSVRLKSSACVSLRLLSQPATCGDAVTIAPNKSFTVFLPGAPVDLYHM